MNIRIPRSMMSSHAKSKGIALVTGAAQGIGRAIALRLADDGFNTAITDISSKESQLEALKKEIADKGRESAVLLADVSSEIEVNAMVEGVVSTLGGLDVMVANAGVAISGPFLQMSAADWDKMFTINARGLFLCYQYAAKQMIKQGRGGRIIGASSLAGKQGHAGLSGYCATKFAVRGITQTAALELGQHGIRVNAYAPGAIETPMLEGLATGWGIDRDALYTAQRQSAALGYHGTPNDVAALVSYLSSKESHFITGQSIQIDGGRYFD